MAFIEYFIAPLAVVVFFAFSVYAAIFMLLTPHAQLRQKHWTVKFIWYYGVSFIIFLVASFYMSFVVWLAIKINGGF